MIGGGSRSRAWIASLLPSWAFRSRLAAGEHGGAFGAARLARMAATGEAPDTFALRRSVPRPFDPDPALTAAYQHRIAEYRSSFDRAHVDC